MGDDGMSTRSSSPVRWLQWQALSTSIAPDIRAFSRRIPRMLRGTVTVYWLLLGSDNGACCWTQDEMLTVSGSNGGARGNSFDKLGYMHVTISDFDFGSPHLSFHLTISCCIVSQMIAIIRIITSSNDEVPHQDSNASQYCTAACNLHFARGSCISKTLATT